MVSVETAKAQDLESVVALDEAFGATHREVVSEAVRGGRCLVARFDGTTAGFLVHDRSFFGQFFIALLKVHPDYRRRGIGSALMRAAEARCTSGKVFTSTNRSNLAMQMLCDALGYVVSGRIENLDEGDPEIVYFKRVVAALTSE